MVTREGDVLGRSRVVGMAERARVGMVAVALRFFSPGRGDRSCPVWVSVLGLIGRPWEVRTQKVPQFLSFVFSPSISCHCMLTLIKSACSTCTHAYTLHFFFFMFFFSAASSFSSSSLNFFSYFSPSCSGTIILTSPTVRLYFTYYCLPLFQQNTCKESVLPLRYL